jgi:hypothetical protein
VEISSRAIWEHVVEERSYCDTGVVFHYPVKELSEEEAIERFIEHEGFVEQRDARA